MQNKLDSAGKVSDTGEPRSANRSAAVASVVERRAAYARSRSTSVRYELGNSRSVSARQKHRDILRERAVVSVCVPKNVGFQVRSRALGSRTHKLSTGCTCGYG